MTDDFLTTPLLQSIPDFINLKPKKKSESMNDYFDQNLANQQKHLFQRVISQLVYLKSEHTQMDQQTGQGIYNLIYNSLNHDELIKLEGSKFHSYMKRW
jgi:hypothetical protein